MGNVTMVKNKQAMKVVVQKIIKGLEPTTRDLVIIINNQTELEVPVFLLEMEIPFFQHVN